MNRCLREAVPSKVLSPCGLLKLVQAKVQDMQLRNCQHQGRCMLLAKAMQCLHPAKVASTYPAISVTTALKHYMMIPDFSKKHKK
eukprot:2565829-Amphidinium_carterae.1